MLLALQVLINFWCLIFSYTCCEALVNSNLFMQRSSCIGRLHVGRKMCKSICSSIICELARDENKLPIYRPTHLITILAAAVLANHSPRIHI